MRLRAYTRLPGRYREDDILPLPGTARFVHPTVPYNPNLPPAAFPTLDTPRAVGSQPEEVMEPRQSPDSEPEPEQELPTRPKRATVFHGKRDLYHLSGSPAPRKPDFSGPGLQETPSNSKHVVSQKRKFSAIDQDPGEFNDHEDFVSDDLEHRSARVGLKAYEMHGDWAHIPDGLKLIIVWELRIALSFDEAMRQLILTDEEIEQVLDLQRKEHARQEEEDATIARSQALQLDKLMNGACTTSRDSFAALLERDLYANVKEPATFIIRERDLETARSFLKSLNLGECAERLWRYNGVAQSPSLPDFVPLGDQQDCQALPFPTTKSAEMIDMDLKTSEKTKRGKSTKTPPRKLPSVSPANKRVSRGSRVIKLQLPSGLRNSITRDDLEETVASKPAALQSPGQRLPAPPPVPVARKAQSSRVKYISRKEKAAEKLQSVPSTSSKIAVPGQGEFELTPPTGEKGHIGQWLLSQLEPYVPIQPQPDSTNSTQESSTRALEKHVTKGEGPVVLEGEILATKYHAGSGATCEVQLKIPLRAVRETISKELDETSGFVATEAGTDQSLLERDVLGSIKPTRTENKDNSLDKNSGSSVQHQTPKDFENIIKGQRVESLVIIPTEKPQTNVRTDAARDPASYSKTKLQTRDGIRMGEAATDEF